MALCRMALCPMALSYVLWPCPVSYGPVLCPMTLSYDQLFVPPVGSTLHLTDFAELRPGGKPVCRIPQPEIRGVTLTQLRQLLSFIRNELGLSHFVFS